MSVLVRPLLCLPHLDSLVKEIDSFIILFFELCFQAFILNNLQLIHLELSH